MDWLRLFIFVPMRVLYWPFMYFCQIKKNKIVFLNFNGRGYGCNPKYICEALRKSGETLDLVWLTKDRKHLPDDVRNVDIKSFRALWEMATAKVWISNNRLPYYIAKKKKQYYVQTWHGCLGFKECEKGIDMPLYYRLRSKNDSKMMNLLMTNSKFSTDYFKKVFWYDGEYIEKGSARNDILINTDFSLFNKVKANFNMEQDCKILLYAPTFRNNDDLSIFQLPFEKILSVLKERFGGHWKCLVRLHPVLINKSGLLEYSDSVINASKYPDIQELLAVSDFLITDYSSCLFDYIITQKPALFYAPDYEKYQEERKPMYDPQTLPCLFCRDIKELFYSISQFDKGDYEIKVESFFKSMLLNETGKASQYIADMILKEVSEDI